MSDRRASTSGDTPSSPTAFILAGGLGTRLRSIVADRPKVLASVAGRPWLSFLFDQLASAGITRVVVGTGYLGEQVEAAFGSAYGPLSLFYSREEEHLGTGGALRLAMPRFAGEQSVLVMNGDSYCDVDLPRFIAWHRHRAGAASILLTRVPDASRYGTVETRDDGSVVAFSEKNTLSRPASGSEWINAGAYCLDGQVIETIPEGRAVSLEREVFPHLLGRGLHGYRAGGRFIDMGTPDSFAEAQKFFPLTTTGGVLLDRDGTVIVERHYLADPAGVELLPGAAEGIRRMRSLGLKLAIVSNQSGVGRGYLDESTLRAIHDRMEALLAAEGASLDGIFYCPHSPDAGCDCRKPATGLAERAAHALGFSLSRAIVVGDKSCDLEMGRQLGLPTVLVTTGYGQREHAAGVTADAVVTNLSEAADVIATMRSARSEPSDPARVGPGAPIDAD